MSSYVGLDWTSGRWLAVAFVDGRIESRVFPSALAAWRRYRDADGLLIDVPIGLPDTEPRACDQRAREYVHPDRQGSVFPTPARRAIDAFPHEAASRENEAAIGRGISAQTWGIVPCIRDVDALLQTVPAARPPASEDADGDPRGRLREAHPEVCFAALAPDGAPVTESKTTDQGREQRFRALETVENDPRQRYETVIDQQIEWPKQFSRRLRSSDRDDILDALALAIVARESDGDPQTLPEAPATDSTGLPMEICYWGR